MQFPNIQTCEPACCCDRVRLGMSLSLRRKRWSNLVVLTDLAVEVIEGRIKKTDCLLQYAHGQWTWTGLSLSFQQSTCLHARCAQPSSPCRGRFYIWYRQSETCSKTQSLMLTTLTVSLLSNLLLESPVEKNGNIWASNKALSSLY